MKILSVVSVWLGVLLLLGGLGVAIWGGWIAYWHYAALSTGRSAEFENPLFQLAGAGALLALGGFLAGLGLGMPRPRSGTDPSPNSTE